MFKGFQWMQLYLDIKTKQKGTGKAINTQDNKNKSNNNDDDEDDEERLSTARNTAALYTGHAKTIYYRKPGATEETKVVQISRAMKTWTCELNSSVIAKTCQRYVPLNRPSQQSQLVGQPSSSSSTITDAHEASTIAVSEVKNPKSQIVSSAALHQGNLLTCVIYHEVSQLSLVRQIAMLIEVYRSFFSTSSVKTCK
ncbi:hypothetical protein BDC45DRAFT_210213 [Circinella umbellata]|nr:hypothetical protein BDC45DRAFT_210213 [Circinella umbellata]